MPEIQTGEQIIPLSEIAEGPSSIVGKMAWDISRRENGPLEKVALARIQEEIIKTRQQVQEAKERFKAAPRKHPKGLKVDEVVTYRRVKGHGWAELGSQDNGLVESLFLEEIWNRK